MTPRSTCPNGHPFPENQRQRGGRIYCSACRIAQRRNPITLDPVAVERAIAGNPPAHLNHLEIAEAVLALDRDGYTARQIADRVGCCRRTVIRVRVRNRQTPA